MELKGKRFYIDTTYQFLNKVFGTNYNKCMASSWNLQGTDVEIFVWMVIMDEEGKIFTNYDQDDIIIEDNKNLITTYKGLDIIEINRTHLYRIAVKINKINNKRVYEIKGLNKFKYDDSNLKTHLLEMISF